MKLVLGVFLVFLYGIWHYKRHIGKKQLRAVEEGRACLSCHGTDIAPEANGNVRCNTCGHITDMAWLNEAAVDSREMAAMARPEELRRRR